MRISQRKLTTLLRLYQEYARKRHYDEMSAEPWAILTLFDDFSGYISRGGKNILSFHDVDTGIERIKMVIKLLGDVGEPECGRWDY